MDANDFKLKLVEEITNCDEILGIGQTGDINAPLIEGKSDIDLFDQWYASEACRMIDEEELGRAELRHEVLFYHQVVEEFLDHFLQALYAKNRRYFPSRKRTERAIAAFERKPQDCYERLLKIVHLGSDEKTIDDSIEELRKLCKELKEL